MTHCKKKYPFNVTVNYSMLMQIYKAKRSFVQLWEYS